MTEFSNYDVPTGIASDLGIVQQKLFQNFARHMKAVFCQGLRFFSIFKHSRQEQLIENEPRRKRISCLKTDKNVDRIQDRMLSYRQLKVIMIGEKLNLICHLS